MMAAGAAARGAGAAAGGGAGAAAGGRAAGAKAGAGSSRASGAAGGAAGGGRPPKRKLHTPSAADAGAVASGPPAPDAPRWARGADGSIDTDAVSRVLEEEAAAQAEHDSRKVAKAETSAYQEQATRNARARTAAERAQALEARRAEVDKATRRARQAKARRGVGRRLAGAPGDIGRAAVGRPSSTDAAGVLTAVLVWGWVILPAIRYGPTGPLLTLRAKFFNKGPDGSFLP